MKLSVLFFGLMSLMLAFSVGCGGTAENSVSAPPAAAQTPEEMAAQQKAYAEEQAKMQQRDQQSGN